MAEHLQDLVRVQEALFDEHVDEAFVTLDLAYPRVFELLGRQSRLADQDLAEFEGLASGAAEL